MQFLVLANDGDDSEAPSRRQKARQAHIALGDKLVESGNMLYGAAILSDSGAMIGSVLIVDFPSRAEVDAWLEEEPYVRGDVWRQVEIKPCAVGPSFVGLHR